MKAKCAICHKNPAGPGKNIVCAICLFKKHLGDLGLTYSTEHRFHPERRWRFDFAIMNVETPLAVEIEGGTWANGRHTRGAGFKKDCVKYNHATMMGWRVLRFTTDQVNRGESKEFLKFYL